MSENVEESAMRGGFCQFSDKKTDAHFVEKRREPKNAVEIFCKGGRQKYYLYNRENTNE